MIIGGVNVFPSQIETVLMNIPEVGNDYQIVLEREGGLDRMYIKVEISSKMFHGDLKELKKLESEIVAVRIDDKPGGLRKASEVLPQNSLNVEDAYGFTIHGTGQAIFVFQVENMKQTEEILKAAGFPILDDRELYYLG